MTRVKKVFRNSGEVAHIWAQQNGVNVEGRCANVFFEGSSIWSYGRHFCMARILPNGVAVITNRTYSSTTAKHLSEVRSAVDHRKRVYCEEPLDSASSNKRATERDMEQALEAADTDRKIRDFTRWAYRGAAIRHMDQFNEYLAALPKEERGDVKPIKMVGIDELRHLVGESAAKQRAIRDERRTKNETAREAKRVEQRRLNALALAEKIPAWRTGQGDSLPYDAPMMLRLSANRIQTSRSAEIPVRAAKLLWPMILKIKASGFDEPMVVRLGSYTLNIIRADGSIKVGCHDIPFTEIEMIAEQLGLKEKT